MQVGSIIFLSEWGDRSMLATVALGASHSPLGETCAEKDIFISVGYAYTFVADFQCQRLMHMLCACRCKFGRCAGPCSCNPAGRHRWCPRIKVHFGKGAGLCGRITILTICSSHPLWSLLRLSPIRASCMLAKDSHTGSQQLSAGMYWL